MDPAVPRIAAAAGSQPMRTRDHEQAAVRAHLAGDDIASDRAWAAAVRAATQAGDAAEAARCAFWLGLTLAMRGKDAPARGWFRRAERAIEDAGTPCAASGYLLLPAFLGALACGDAGTALALSLDISAAAKRFGDPELAAFGTLAQAQALIAGGQVVEGTHCLDEAMVAVSAHDVGPITAGIIYCAVIVECLERFDLQRAAEWTDALGAWCDARPDIVPYGGQCFVHRSQIESLAGEWGAAMTSASTAVLRLTDQRHPALGVAHYQVAEIHRLTGAFEDAERAYESAKRHGFEPLPGLALLVMARGDQRAALAMMRRAVAEHDGAVNRPALLAAAADIFYEGGDGPALRDAAAQLTAAAGTLRSPIVDAMAAQARGTELLAGGRATSALTELRTAARQWAAVGLPYHSARTAMLIGQACANFGDHRSAALEFQNAAAVLARLGARPDLARLESLRLESLRLEPRRLGSRRAPTVATRDNGGQDRVRRQAALSARERQVLAELVAGKTNRQIAETLAVSRHTIDRHVQHIFSKLGVSSRAAATAHAYEHQLL